MVSPPVQRSSKSGDELPLSLLASAQPYLDLMSSSSFFFCGSLSLVFPFLSGPALWRFAWPPWLPLQLPIDELGVEESCRRPIALVLRRLGW